MALTDRWLEALMTTWLKRPERMSLEHADRLLKVGYWLVARSRRRPL